MPTMESGHETPYPALLAAAELEVAALEVICEMLEKEHVSQAELARRLGVSRPYVTNLMKGRMTLPLRRLAEAAYLLGYNVTLEIHKLEGR